MKFKLLPLAISGEKRNVGKTMGADRIFSAPDYAKGALNIEMGLRFPDETHAIQAAIAGQGVAIVSSLLAKDFIDKQIFTAPFNMALPGGKYFFVTTQEKAQQEDVRELKLSIEESIAGC
ncbi:LysR family transcriptional regulator [Yersinia intermedia]|uniref:hypothetical protein n=1 Tax=Yersinia intermedia TaxID=631 RepID=UPI001641BB8C|nr:hypothetical protein [Yersinia intermedia]